MFPSSDNAFQRIIAILRTLHISRHEPVFDTESWSFKMTRIQSGLLDHFDKITVSVSKLFVTLASVVDVVDVADVVAADL